jgi:hypothetical protein
MSLLCEMNGVSRPSALAARNLGEIIQDSGFLLFVSTWTELGLQLMVCPSRDSFRNSGDKSLSVSMYVAEVTWIYAYPPGSGLKNAAAYGQMEALWQSGKANKLARMAKKRKRTPKSILKLPDPRTIQISRTKQPAIGQLATLVRSRDPSVY